MPDKQLTEEQLKALQAMGALSATVAIPPASILPFQNLIKDDALVNIKKQEAMRMFPQADPNIFEPTRGGSSKKTLDVIPLTEQIASNRVFDADIKRKSPLNLRNIYNAESFFPEYLSNRPGTPSPELGSFAQAISDKTIFPEGDIQAITVTPGPNPGRFAKDYADILADKLGKTLNEYEYSLSNSVPASIEELKAAGVSQELIDEQQNLKNPYKLLNKIEALSKKVPGTAGYVWDNVSQPQYSYAEGNWGLGQKLAGENPSIYLSRINADPAKEAQYLYTGNVLTSEKTGGVDPRSRFKQYENLGPGTGPSWGIASNEDISFRKDLIGARGELTTGDLQALLAERNLPFAYQTQGASGLRKKPGEVLRLNLETLASSENISPSQAAEKYARLIPNVGEPVTPPTPAVVARGGEFPAQGQAVSPFGEFASKTDLRQIGILPPADKARYSPPFGVDVVITEGFDDKFVPIKSVINEGINIDRDTLRPQAANKLLDRTVKNLIEEAKPIQGLGLGGLATGAVATAMDPAVIDALSRGDYMQAGTTAALNTSIGSAMGALTAKGLQALQAAGYARPAAAIGTSLPLAGGLLGGQGLVETGKALNRAYRARTGEDWVTRNQTAKTTPTYTGPTPSIQPRMGTAILGGKPIQVPYGSVAGTKTVGRPWWDQAGSRIQKFADLLNRGSIIGR